MNSDEVEVVFTDSVDDDDTEYPGYIICREFKLTLISAQNLPEVRTLFDSRVVAKVTIGNDESTEKETEADEENGLNPVWNTYVRYNLPESSTTQNTAETSAVLMVSCSFGERFLVKKPYVWKKVLVQGAYLLIKL